MDEGLIGIFLYKKQNKKDSITFLFNTSRKKVPQIFFKIFFKSLFIFHFFSGLLLVFRKSSRTISVNIDQNSQRCSVVKHLHASISEFEQLRIKHAAF